MNMVYGQDEANLALVRSRWQDIGVFLFLCVYDMEFTFSSIHKHKHWPILSVAARHGHVT